MYERAFKDYIRNSIIAEIGYAAGNDPGQEGATQGDDNSGPDDLLLASANDEEPVNFFDKNSSQEVFNKVVEWNIKQGKFKEGDNKFYVYGHGAYGDLLDMSGENDVRISTAKKFDEIMSAKSPAYKNAIEEGTAFTLFLYTCRSAKTAQKISAAHPNAIIVGFDGYLFYGKGKDGNPSITGISSNKNVNLHDRNIIIYKGGVPVRTTSP